MTKRLQPDLHEQGFLLLLQTTALSRKLGERELAPFHITIAEYTLLRIVQNTPRITASEARKRLFASAPSLAQLVKSLNRKGLIKSDADSRDIRRQPLLLTQKGTQITRKARIAIRQALRTLVVSSASLHSLVDILSSLLPSLSSYGD